LIHFYKRNKSKIMSLTGTASRFACLPDDDSADWKGLKQKQKKEDAKKNQTKPKDSNKAKVQNESKELQNLAFGAPKKKNKKKNPNKEKKTSRSATSQDKEESQFEEWKERDKALENDNFTAAMQEAILRSQLEYEEQQAMVEAERKVISEAGGEGSDAGEVLAGLTKEEKKESN